MRQHGYRESGADEDQLLTRMYGAGGPPTTSDPQQDKIPVDASYFDDLSGDDDLSGNPFTREDWVAWDSLGTACPICLMNVAADPRPYGTPFPSGDIEPPAHGHCHCFLVKVAPPGQQIIPPKTNIPILIEPGNGSIVVNERHKRRP